MCLRVHGEAINLTVHEFAIVELFMRRPKKVFTKQDIYETIWQQVRIQQERASNELKYTISCISHDIRTPLTGAAGYLELLLKITDPIKQKKYETIIQERLQDLEKMLDELFLYTKLSQQEYSLECSPIQPFPILCEVMADYYERITNSGLEPNISFLEESVEFLAEPESLKCIFRNLIQNAISYGGEYLIIEQKEERILFRNRVQTGELIDITRIFDRFYKADHSRHDKSSGLGLSIVKQLMEKMGGMVDAALDNEGLIISLAFRK
ncbi:Alkaline phosphatase synthesis sensor protein PhoR [Clostridiales bacterium CHKCI001]|nr:Alkaline phosphatase synthesis sensor protein PhoR [Clostridiales bacterium CHKCI001]